MRDVFYDWFDDERAPRPVSKTPPARLAARRKLLDSLLVEIASADDPLARITMPRSASAGASPRKATRFNTPEGITRRECARRSGDQRVHRNPVTLVTPTVRYPGAKLAHDQQRPIGSDGVALQS